MKVANIIWGIIFGFMLSVICLSLKSHNLSRQNKQYEYIGFADYSEEMVSLEQLKEIISEKYERVPSYGYGQKIVKNPDTAAKIGIAILSSKFGADFINRQKPFSVSLINQKVWMVQGRSSSQQAGSQILIQRSDASILSIKK